MKWDLKTEGSSCNSVNPPTLFFLLSIDRLCFFESQLFKLAPPSSSHLLLIWSSWWIQQLFNSNNRPARSFAKTKGGRRWTGGEEREVWIVFGSSSSPTMGVGEWVGRGVGMWGGLTAFIGRLKLHTSASFRVFLPDRCCKVLQQLCFKY